MRIVKNQLNYLAYLDAAYLYEDLIRYATITLQLALKEKRYEEALTCYYYLANAYHDVGANESFFELMVDYESVCLKYGDTFAKMKFHMLYRLMCGIMQKHIQAIEAGKRAVSYAHQLQDYQMISAELGHLCAQYCLIDDLPQAKVCARLSEHYEKKQINHFTTNQLRKNSSILLYYAMARETEKFYFLKTKLAQELFDKEPTMYQGQLAVLEGLFLAKDNKVKESSISFTKALILFEKQDNGIYCSLTLKFIRDCGLEDKINHYNVREKDVSNWLQEKSLDQSITRIARTDLLHADFLHDFSTIKAVSYHRNLAGWQAVQQKWIEQNKPYFCVAWSFNTNEIVTIFGQDFEAHHCLHVVEKIIEVVANQPVHVTMSDTNKGFLLIGYEERQRVNQLLERIVSSLQDMALKVEEETMIVTIHFGVVHHLLTSSDRLLSKADAYLYYAISQRRLFMPMSE